MTEQGKDLQLADVLDDAITARLLELNTCTLGKITEFDASTLMATAQPLQNRKIQGQVIARAEVEAPVLFVSSGEFVVNSAPKEGDVCLILYSHRSLDGFTGEAYTPIDYKMHDESDAIIVPLCYVKNTSLAANAFGLQTKDHKKFIEIRESEVAVGSTDGTKINLLNSAGAVGAQLQQMFTILDAVLIDLIALANTPTPAPTTVFNPAVATDLATKQTNLATIKTTLGSILT